MRRRMVRLAMALVATCCGAPAQAVEPTSSPPPVTPSARPAAGMPRALAAYVKRRRGCNHWMGEDAYDAARGREIAAAVNALRCDAIEADETRLRKRYGREPAALKALDEARDADG